MTPDDHPTVAYRTVIAVTPLIKGQQVTWQAFPSKDASRGSSDHSLEMAEHVTGESGGLECLLGNG